MKRVMIIGCPGSGKSTFSKKLHNLTGLPLYHMDMMYWNANRTIVEKFIFRERLSAIIQNDEWIIDGNYGSTVELRLQACDTVFFLDYSTDICLEGVRERRGKARSDMPWVESVDEEDAEFIEFIKNFNLQSRPEIIDLLNKYSDKDIHILKNRNDADEFLESLLIKVKEK